MNANSQTIKIEHDDLRSIGELLREREKTIILKGADILTAEGFTQVPNHVLRSKKTSPGAKLTYAMLLSYAWNNEYCLNTHHGVHQRGSIKGLFCIVEKTKSTFVVVSFIDRADS
jgi:hypothetical protein